MIENYDEFIKNKELHYVNSLFVHRLEEAIINIDKLDEIAFDKMKADISKVVNEQIFEQIISPIDEYARTLSDISHIAGMRFMLQLLCCLNQ